MILIIIFIIIIIFIFFIKPIREKFDAKIEQVSENECGTMCTKVVGCAGFGYCNDKCWLARQPIIGRPEKSLYLEDYKPNIKRCNKFYTISDLYIAATGDYQKNMSYVCQNGENGDLVLTTYLNDKKILEKPEDIDKIMIRDYPMKNVKWPAPFDRNTITSEFINSIVKDEPVQNVYVMRNINDKIEGDYLYDHKCVSNVNELDCIQDCLKNKDCVGTEWIPEMEANNEKTINICCPIKKINKILNNNNKDNLYFVKNNIQKNDIDKNKAIIIK